MKDKNVDSQVQDGRCSTNWDFGAARQGHLPVHWDKQQLGWSKQTRTSCKYSDFKIIIFKTYFIDYMIKQKNTKDKIS